MNTIPIYTLTPEDKIFWLSTIETRIGLVLPEIQQRHFESRIIDKMKQHQLSSDEYYKKITHSQLEWQILTDDLTIPETSFFRHKESFDLAQSFFKMQEDTINIWSVGCSSGEEAWSLAIIAQEEKKIFKVLATDVNILSLDKGQEAIYTQRRLQGVPHDYKNKYFKQNNEGNFQVVSVLKEQVNFCKYNLTENQIIPFKNMDLIFCQNVLIYFRNFIQRDILNQLVSCLSIGGLLVIGPGEARTWKHKDMERIDYDGTLAYKRLR